ncbi:hypothetical protein [Agromyces sp. NBRC 114283]|uniref:hypothetical protein n=1 Tax=Agromyces sp. NBRC 114283 TaxID=2994521 RepID=UPI0025537B48|nr:hypothetical protein [Agromyces sp. NBRC 114283]
MNVANSSRASAGFVAEESAGRAGWMARGVESGEYKLAEISLCKLIFVSVAHLTENQALEILQQAGMDARIEGAADLKVDGALVNLKVRSRPSRADLVRELERHQARHPRDVVLGYVVPRITPALEEIARHNRQVILVSVNDRTIIHGEVRHELPLLSEPSARPPSKRTAWARFGLMRVLAMQLPLRRQIELAEAVGVSQPAISHALRELGDVAQAARNGSKTAAGELFDQFVDQYPGAGGFTTDWFRLDTPSAQAHDVHRQFPDTLVSGDVGADELAPWRVVRRAAVYATRGLPLSELDFAEADEREATLTLTVAKDPTIWATAAAWGQFSSAIATVDPILVAYDVSKIGGPDTGEAVQKVREMVDRRWS